MLSRSRRFLNQGDHQVFAILFHLLSNLGSSRTGTSDAAPEEFF